MTKIMLCEDDIEMRMLLTTLLNLEGYQVSNFIGDSQEELSENLATELPDILLMDVHLQHKNGLDYLKALRANEIFKRLQVVMTSGMDLRQECMQMGANAFIMKPYMPGDLIVTLRSICGKKT
jgi:DNA-binding response OmpR family regulator